MTLKDKYISYIRNIRRYSVRTVDIYDDVLRNFLLHAHGGENVSDSDLLISLNHSEIRSYEAARLEEGLSARTVCLHLSALSSFCRYLVKEGHLKSNPVKLVAKPRQSKRLPEFYRKEAMNEYFERTSYVLDPGELDFFIRNHDTRSGKEMYEDRLRRLIISMLYSLGLRRAELIGLCIGDVDFGRNIVKVLGKGNKMREIPLIPSLCDEILLYLKAVETMCGGERSLKEPLLVTYRVERLYPAYVDRAVKKGLKDFEGMTGRKSPHVLRHSLATGLMNEDVNINSIKELLGHSSLAATQVYTHGTIAKLKSNYEQAHPRAKNGGKHGD